MSAPVFLCADLAPDHLLLTGAEGRHAAGAKRLHTGELVDLVDGAGTRAACRVTSVRRDEVSLQVLSRQVEPAPRVRLVLVQALPKGERGELAVELATEVGIDEVVPWSAARCVMQWKGERGERALQRWRATAREAAKQSRRARLPTIPALVGTAALLPRVRGAALALVLHESGPTALSAVDPPTDGEVLLVVGPEGGLSEEELDALGSVGGRVVRLGPTVLRTSTAGAAAAVVLNTRTGRW